MTKACVGCDTFPAICVIETADAILSFCELCGEHMMSRHARCRVSFDTTWLEAQALAELEEAAP